MSFGYVVDFACPPKQVLGGTLAAATRVAEGARLAPDASACAPCVIACRGAVAEGPACLGIVTTPVSAEAERWLAARLPEALESLPGEVLKQAVQAGFQGARAAELRRAGKLAAKAPFTRGWGGLFRRFTVTTDQLIEQMFCAGDVEPAHALAILVQLGAVSVDGRVPVALDEGAGLAEVTAETAGRRARTQCAVTPTAADDASIAELKRFLSSLHAAFCVDARVIVVSD
jgi:hypothetical protein